ncbi:MULTISPECIES: DUF2255 family protein [Lactococcus]|uniref:DUF2255 family protein n=1 Tax=Lactococcus TaxID=1357 RepID=UPI00024D8FD1|nr:MULTISPECIES: DUF2255 family protein [Lactococcus]MCA2381452.1 DUF2255 family protein [Lactococcus sp. SK2-659]MCI2095620.1 DUF2255 family protein [Lactococcus lactis]MCI2139539.1 DUF2255 family protein [Lactococcus lactis]MCI2189036.1 DUF2255 family protein [Lactococcus lactis]THA53368.1 DUF2255 family protein [Lactococcus lactis]
MKIDVKKFSKIQDIYISPDPQEHRPAWIWFAYIDDDLAVAAGRGTASSWWHSAMLSRKGQIHIDGKVYQVEFEPVTDKENIDKFIASYRQRAGHSWDPAWEKNFRPTVMRLKFLKELGKSTR